MHCMKLGQEEYPHIASKEGTTGEACTRIAIHIDQQDYSCEFPDLTDDLMEVMLYLGMLEEEVRVWRSRYPDEEASPDI